SLGVVFKKSASLLHAKMNIRKDDMIRICFLIISVIRKSKRKFKAHIYIFTLRIGKAVIIYDLRINTHIMHIVERKQVITVNIEAGPFYLCLAENVFRHSISQ